MSDEEIRDLLDLAAEDMEFGRPIEAEDTWAAGRRSRTTSRAWGTGFLAAAAAAVVGIVWTQGLGGSGEVPLPPAAESGPVPTDNGPAGTDPTGPDDQLASATGPLEETDGVSDFTHSPTEGEAEEPTGTIGIPDEVGTPTVLVMSEGEWAPSGELTPLTAEEAVDRRWMLVETDGDTPRVDSPESDYGLTFDDSGVHVRSCGVDVTVTGAVQDGTFSTTGRVETVEDPDPGVDCPVPVTPDEWAQILTSKPRLSTDGEILLIAGTAGDTSPEPAGLALLPDGVDDPRGGPTTVVTAEDLSAGLTEVPGEVASQEVGVSDSRDPQPDHATTLTMEGGFVTVDVGCAEPLRGPAWFSHVGPESFNWQLTAALPDEPGCEGAAAEDAELWQQMLAHGTFLHHFGDYVVVDSWADPALNGSGS